MTRVPWQFPHDSAANWTANNPTLLDGELGVESDTHKAKVGDGSTAWSSLPYIGAAGSGTVTTVSVVSAHGFSGSVANPTSTPAITLNCTVTGILKGDGTSISAAAAGTDYVAPGGALGTPASGNLANCTFPTLNQNTSGTAAGLSGTPNINVGTISGTTTTLVTAQASIQTATLKIQRNASSNYQSLMFVTGVTYDFLIGRNASSDDLQFGVWNGASYTNVATLTTAGALTAASFNSITGLSSTNPAMNGAVAVGTATTVARADHVHPVDTSRQAAATILGTLGALSNAAGYLQNNGSGGLSWAAGTGGASWGSITGTLSSQSDLNTALNGKQASATILTTFSGLANAAGWLRNDGAGALSYSTPTAAQVGAESSGAVATHAALQTGVHGISITAAKTFSCTNNLTLAGTDGSTLNIGAGGTLNTGAFVVAYSLPTATSSVLGGVKPDGTSILNAAGVLSATAASVGALASGGTAANASQLLGNTWAAPAAIGTGTPAAATFTTCSGTFVATSQNNTGQGAITKDAGAGLWIRPITGTSYDLQIPNAANTAAIASVPTGTCTWKFGTPQTGYASANFPNGADPTSPNTGDLWATAVGMFLQTPNGRVALTPAVSTPTWASTITLTTAGFSHIRITLGGATTINFNAGVDGQKLTLELLQDATGSRTVTWGTGVGFGSSLTSTPLTTTANKRDVIGLIYSSSASKWLIVAFQPGF